jgi:hypothetical protein
MIFEIASTNSLATRKEHIMLCPFCLADLQPRTTVCTSSSCQRQLPLEYVTCHSSWWARHHQPAIVSVVGFRGHGKTVYLASLYYVLQNTVVRAWDAFYRQGLTMKSLKMLYENLSLLKKRKLPDSTQLVFPEPNIDRLYKIPHFGDRTLLVYDPPGEAFDLIEDDSLQRFAGFVKHSKCVLFLISLTDMMSEFGSAEGVAGEMDRLLERYNLGMTEMRAPSKAQHLIVVYTKADRPLSDIDFPDEIIKYLEKSEVETLHDMRSYLSTMKQNSSVLKKFTSDVLNAHAFINNAKDHFKDTEFCAVSALGSEPVDGNLAERIAPLRVIDPLLWVLEKS